MVTATLEIALESGARCEILVEDGLLARIPHIYFSNASSAFIISDDIVSKLYAERIKSRLSKFAMTRVVEFPHGERNKNLHTVSLIGSKLSNLGADRKSVLVALGGGVVGDLTGFVASIFKRGIRYIQAPTTLLAQVDSSIGGKTGVDTDWGKNQLGTFYHPESVLIDPSTLDTLPRRQIINGLAEIVKTAIIADRNMFSALSKADFHSVDNLKPFIVNTTRIKAGIVERDEKESNLRSILNYGHTIGHAIEASENFKISHGQAVMLGMSTEGWIAQEMGIFDRDDYEKQEELFSEIGRTNVKMRLDSKKLIAFAKLDKKNTGGTIRMSLPQKIGMMAKKEDGAYTIPVKREVFESAINQLRAKLNNH